MRYLNIEEEFLKRNFAFKNEGDNTLLRCTLLFISILLSLCAPSQAARTIEFGPTQTKIVGAIKYSLVGQYVAEFDRFNGEIVYDDKTHQIQSVDLKIQIASIRSNCSWCDKIVCSKRLMDAPKYPLITFKSSQISKTKNGYQVKGLLKVHGVEKELIFPFSFVESNESKTAQKKISVSGRWLINRKDFGINWNKVLDQGGVVVGNYITVDWGINFS